MKCRACKLQLPLGKSLCPRCRRWTRVEDKPVTIRLSDVQDEGVARMIAGHWSAGLLGGGIVPATVLLVGGEPGVGKSTLSLHLLDACIHETGKDGLYLGVEERPAMLRSRAVRIRCGHLEKMVIPGEELSIELDILDRVGPQCLVIVDSLSRLARNEHQAVRVMRRIADYAQASCTAVIVLDHVTKGQDFAGFMTLQHDVDVTIYLRGDAKRSKRTWQTVKNRHGDGYVTRPLWMDEFGIRPRTEADHEARGEDESGKAEKVQPLMGLGGE